MQSFFIFCAQTFKKGGFYPAAAPRCAHSGRWGGRPSLPKTPPPFRGPRIGGPRKGRRSARESKVQLERAGVQPGDRA
ncbi:hypothetical protein HMPREF0262_01848 [Clostridium sp. ATCC 29733]|nr:hypothetical protein HMPREF0262_01848 [Clostridium sp. ATCC 29733]